MVVDFDVNVGGDVVVDVDVDVEEEEEENTLCQFSDTGGRGKVLIFVHFILIARFPKGRHT